MTRISPPYWDQGWEPVRGLYQDVERGELISTILCVAPLVLLTLVVRLVRNIRRATAA
jgi:hypothetical protein